MPFLILSNVKINFSDYKLSQRLFPTAEALPIIKPVELIRRKEFATIAFGLNEEIFIVYVVIFNSDSDIHPFDRAQLASLLTNNAPTTVLSKSANFANIFSLKSAAELLEYIGINDYPINLVDGQQPLYKPIYSLGLIELEALKIYIKTNLANDFIQTSKSLIERSTYPLC